MLIPVHAYHVQHGTNNVTETRFWIVLNHGMDFFFSHRNAVFGFLVLSALPTNRTISKTTPSGAII
jgi:hypothetical protein